MSGIFLNFNGTSILQLMSFFILMYFLVKFLYRPFLHMLDKRTEDVRSEYERVAKDRKEAEAFKEASKKELEEIRMRIASLEAEAKKRIEEYEILEKSRVNSEIQLMLSNARVQIDEEKMEAEKLMEAKIVTLAVALTSKIIQQDIDEKSKRDFLIRQLSKISEKR